MLFKTVAAKKIDLLKLATHHFTLDDSLASCDTFGNAAKTGTLKPIITA